MLIWECRRTPSHDESGSGDGGESFEVHNPFRGRLNPMGFAALVRHYHLYIQSLKCSVSHWDPMTGEVFANPGHWEVAWSKVRPADVLVSRVQRKRFCAPLYYGAVSGWTPQRKRGLPYSIYLRVRDAVRKQRAQIKMQRKRMARNHMYTPSMLVNVAGIASCTPWTTSWYCSEVGTRICTRVCSTKVGW